jgi:ureidoacrylate peracid hydrolase
MHKIDIPQQFLDQLAAQRGGRLHMIDAIAPARTAHLVIDLQNGFMAPGAAAEVPAARAIVPNVNAISRALRAAGGSNIFLRYATPPRVETSWSNLYARMPAAARQAHRAAFAPGAHDWALWPELDVGEGDAAMDKERFGAFVPGTCDLDALLRDKGVDTVIVTGTLSNICCESTARDAMQRNYRTIFVSDANAALSDAAHNATLANMYAVFADVMDTAELLGILARTAAPAAAPAV